MSFDHATQTLRGTALASIALLSAVTLAACAPSPGESSNVAATAIAEAPESPAPTATPETPVADLQAGDVLDAATAEKLNSEWRSASDDKAYALPNGNNVLIKAGQPLPEPVIAAVTDKVAAAGVGQNVSDGIAAGKAAGDAVRALKAEVANTGRSGVLITHAMSTSGPDGAQAPTFGVSLPQGGPYATYEEALAAAQAWMDISPDTRYIVFVDTLG